VPQVQAQRLFTQELVTDIRAEDEATGTSEYVCGDTVNKYMGSVCGVVWCGMCVCVCVCLDVCVGS